MAPCPQSLRKIASSPPTIEAGATTEATTMAGAIMVTRMAMAIMAARMAVATVDGSFRKWPTDFRLIDAAVTRSTKRIETSLA